MTTHFTLFRAMQAIEFGLTDNSLVVWLPADISTATRVCISHRWSHKGAKN